MQEKSGGKSGIGATSLKGLGCQCEEFELDSVGSQTHVLFVFCFFIRTRDLIQWKLEVSLGGERPHVGDDCNDPMRGEEDL